MGRIPISVVFAFAGRSLSPRPGPQAHLLQETPRRGRPQAEKLPSPSTAGSGVPAHSRPGTGMAVCQLRKARGLEGRPCTAVCLTSGRVSQVKTDEAWARAHSGV